MAEITTTLAGETTEARMCCAGSATERPCWRPVTERDIGETEPTLCALHMELRHRAESMDGWLHALEAMRGFLKSKDVDGDPHGALGDLAIGWYDTVTEEAADEQTAEVARKNRADEQAMTRKIDSNWDRFLDLTLATPGVLAE